MPRDVQTSLSAGELSPSLQSHADLAKYRTGLALCENFFVLAQGGISNRAGFEFINEVVASGEKARLISFSFNTEQTYALVFNNQKMRVVKNGGMVLESTVAITGATQANPVVVTAAGHGYANGDDVFIDGVAGMTEINGRFFRVANQTVNTFELTDYAGNNIDGTAFTAYTSGGTVGRVYTLPTPYLEADLFRLKFTQSADVMTITHPDYDQRDLSRTGDAAWTLTIISYASSISPPSAGLGIVQVGTASGANNKEYRYVITSVTADGDESVASSIQASASINALNETYGNRISWNTVAGADYYNVFKELSLNSGIFGWIGEADEDGSPSFDDYNYGPDMTFTPPEARNPFSGADNKPACVTYHQQRQWFGGSNNNPQTIWSTRTADFDNMDVSRPSRSDDAIEATIAARQVNEIRHLLSLDDLLVFTSGAEWIAQADQDGVLTPSNINFRTQGFRGSSHVPPLVIGETGLFVQEKAGRVRDIRYTFEADRYVGNDLTVLSRHMFENYEIVDWCYSQEPYSIVWVVRDDGTMLSLTYLREQNVYAWCRHTTNGSFESVCSVSEGDQDVVYAVVKRTINGSDVRYVERMKERVWTTIDDAFFVDSGLTYSGAATTTISNLHHLEGETVVALADGNVVQNLVVTDGAVTLPDPAEKVQIGLSYNADFQTLEIAFNGLVMQSRKKQVARVAMRVLESRGLSIGKDSSSLFEFKERTTAMGYTGIPELTGQQVMEVTPGWNDFGQIYCRQSHPLPATVLAVIPELVT